jgi:hypothetical protein
MPVFHAELAHEASVRAPRDLVFERLSDHEGMRDWPGIADARLAREGTPTRNGLGAVRVIRASGLTLDEEVVRWDPPNGLDYRIVKGLPVDHLGTVALTERDGVTAIVWRIRIRSRVPFLAPLLILRLKMGLPKALAWLAEDIERAVADR